MLDTKQNMSIKDNFIKRDINQFDPIPKQSISSFALACSIPPIY